MKNKIIKANSISKYLFSVLGLKARLCQFQHSVPNSNLTNITPLSLDDYINHILVSCQNVHLNIDSPNSNEEYPLHSLGRISLCAHNLFSLKISYSERGLFSPILFISEFLVAQILMNNKNLCSLTFRCVCLDYSKGELCVALNKKNNFKKFKMKDSAARKMTQSHWSQILDALSHQTYLSEIILDKVNLEDFADSMYNILTNCAFLNKVCLSLGFSMDNLRKCLNVIEHKPNIKTLFLIPALVAPQKTLVSNRTTLFGKLLENKPFLKQIFADEAFEYLSMDEYSSIIKSCSNLEEIILNNMNLTHNEKSTNHFLKVVGEHPHLTSFSFSQILYSYIESTKRFFRIIEIHSTLKSVCIDISPEDNPWNEEFTSLFIKSFSQSKLNTLRIFLKDTKEEYIFECLSAALPFNTCLKTLEILREYSDDFAPKPTYYYDQFAEGLEQNHSLCTLTTPFFGDIEKLVTALKSNKNLKELSISCNNKIIDSFEFGCLIVSQLSSFQVQARYLSLETIKGICEAIENGSIISIRDMILEVWDILDELMEFLLETLSGLKPLYRLIIETTLYFDNKHFEILKNNSITSISIS